MVFSVLHALLHAHQACDGTASGSAGSGGWYQRICTSARWDRELVAALSQPGQCSVDAVEGGCSFRGSSPCRARCPLARGLEHSQRRLGPRTRGCFVTAGERLAQLAGAVGGGCSFRGVLAAVGVRWQGGCNVTSASACNGDVKSSDAPLPSEGLCSLSLTEDVEHLFRQCLNLCLGPAGRRRAHRGPANATTRTPMSQSFSKARPRSSISNGRCLNRSRKPGREAASRMGYRFSGRFVRSSRLPPPVAGSKLRRRASDSFEALHGERREPGRMLPAAMPHERNLKQEVCVQGAPRAPFCAHGNEREKRRRRRRRRRRERERERERES